MLCGRNDGVGGGPLWLEGKEEQAVDERGYPQSRQRALLSWLVWVLASLAGRVHWRFWELAA